jgi:hypothetical protein
MTMTDKMPQDGLQLQDLAAWIEASGGVLADALGQWAGRDDSRAQPEVTRAGHTAVDVIDAMLTGLHRARSKLVGEIREHQDAAAARVDALLAQHRSGGDSEPGPCLDSELWTCLGCGGQMIGRRPAGDLCRYCAPGGAR